MKEFEYKCRKEAQRKKGAPLEKAVAKGMDLASLDFLSFPVIFPDTSLGGATALDELTKLFGSKRLCGNIQRRKNLRQDWRPMQSFDRSLRQRS